MGTNAAVFFDLDGTLLDTADDFVLTVEILCDRYEVTPPNATAIRNTVSDGARALVKLAFACDEDSCDFEPLRNELLTIYERVLGQQTRLFDGLQDTLYALQHLALPWGVVTNKPRRFAAPLMQRMNIQPAAAVLVCPDDVVHTKPHPEPLYLAAKEVGARPANCLYVGDHARDIDAGRNAGMKTIAAAYGYVDDRAETEAWNADHIIDHGHELQSIIRDLYLP
ncbi:MAG: HAD-IA family hydrolase [Pseudomonadota bacterium]